MTINRSRKRNRLAMVVVRSPTRQGVAGNLLEDPRRVQMERQTGDSRVVTIMASPEEVRAVMAARPSTEQSPAAEPTTTLSVATETQRRLLAYAHRARHLLVRREITDGLERNRRREMAAEIRRLKDMMQALQEEVEVTTRSVESMERLVVHLERLTRDLLPSDTADRFNALNEAA